MKLMLTAFAFAFGFAAGVGFEAHSCEGRINAAYRDARDARNKLAIAEVQQRDTARLHAESRQFLAEAKALADAKRRERTDATRLIPPQRLPETPE